MIVTIAAFALQEINKVYIKSPAEADLALSWLGLKKGYLWQLLTFQFLHAGLSHLLFNLIGLWFFGRHVESVLGPRKFLSLYLLCGVAGGLFQCLLGVLVPAVFGRSVLGASAGVLGVMAAFCLLEPESEILVMFVLPLKARFLLYAEIAIALFFTLVPSDPYIAHAAHLGGILFAIGFIRWMDRLPSFIRWPSVRLPRRTRELVKTRSESSSASSAWRQTKSQATLDTPSDEFISKEVDPILDKISAHGIHSLTPRERQILEAARARMGKR